MTFAKPFFVISGLLSITIQHTCLIISEKENQCPSFGDTCTPYDKQLCCGHHLVCKKSKLTNYRSECLCDVDYEWFSNKCVKIADRLCVKNDDCRDRKYTKCSEEKKCVCNSNYAKLDFSTCRPLIGSYCEETKECFVDNSVCISERCHCAEGFISQSNERCLPTFFELSCKSGEECQEAEFFSCHRGKCSCPANHVIVNGRNCVPLLNENCTENKQCIVHNSECINQMCKCRPNYVARSNNRCLSTHLYGKCKTDDDCSILKASKCSEFNDCVCKVNYFYFNETTCSPIIGGDCFKDADCLTGNSTCINFTCQCKPHYESIFLEKCKPIFHKSCKIDNDCIDRNFTECAQNKTCVCKSNYITSEKEELCLAPLLEKCEKNSDCVTENSYCHVNECLCNRSYFPRSIRGTYRCEQVLLGNSCEENDDCSSIKFAECSTNSICICKSNHFALKNRASCSPIIGDYCFNDKECQFENSHCFNNICQCQSSYIAVSNHQCILRTLAICCESVIDCGLPWHSECSPNHNCFCKGNNTQTSNRGVCLPLIGGVCWRDNQCQVTNSVCRNFRCQCIEPDFYKFGNSLCIPVSRLSSST